MFKRNIVFVVYRTFLFLFLISIFFLVLIFYVPNIAINSNMKQKNILISTLPQGWAFFTKDPKEERISLYWDKNPFEEYDFIGTRFNEYFGFDREVRKYISEIINMSSLIPENNWVQGDFNKIIYFKGNQNLLSIDKKHKYFKNFCSKNYVYIKHKPQIRAWRYFENTQKVKYTKVKFVCN
ncbi:SdpA family antimicrobial peptide system protein [Pigmentibacter sp. JX0631]|uniref:SdpA family antimicrobial peptide system protein n=1 Tax=Pigmentibacter sp. JX0631 TaxID=2976982 RepID=UPI002468D564|nr:SdpA family antimicrobial peptide system protein [Pigmentibacter sp. JX0631]WGL61510.1 SdpA family antimicrobial peptide system protein [Pigmentibacter sp. JX0631]